jgi:hypothetical protein
MTVTDFFVKDLDGKEVSLASISKKKPTLFIFVRHFG